MSKEILDAIGVVAYEEGDRPRDPVHCAGGRAAGCVSQDLARPSRSRAWSSTATRATSAVFTLDADPEELEGHPASAIPSPSRRPKASHCRSSPSSPRP